MTTAVSVRGDRSLTLALMALALATVIWAFTVPSARAGIPLCDVNASSDTAVIDDVITFTGTGFTPNTLISVYGQIDGGPLALAATGQTDGAGEFVFSATMTVVGVVTVIFEQDPGCSDSTTVTVSCLGDVSASATSVLAGDVVTFTGTGFAPNMAISVYGSLDGGPFALAATGTTNGSGVFVFTAPLGQVGVVTVRFEQVNQCSDSTAVTVGAAATQAPSASGLPNAAMSAPPAPGATSVVALLLGLLIGLAAVAVATVRRT